MGGHELPQISDEMKEVIKAVFNEDPRMSLKIAALQNEFHNMTLWNFLKGYI